MATFNADNYAASRVTKPSTKYSTGEQGGKIRTLVDRKTLVDAAGTAGLDSGDEITMGYLEDGSKVLDAYVRINKSLGATGIFDLGHRAYTDGDGNTVSEDQDAFVKSADGGGQAAVQRAGADNANAGLGKRFSIQNGGQVQVFAKCTEVMDDTVLDAVLEAVIFYVKD